MRSIFIFEHGRVVFTPLKYKKNLFPFFLLFHWSKMLTKWVLKKRKHFLQKMHFIQCCKFLNVNKLVSFPKNTFAHYSKEVEGKKYQDRNIYLQLNMKADISKTNFIWPKIVHQGVSVDKLNFFWDQRSEGQKFLVYLKIPLGQKFSVW